MHQHDFLEALVGFWVLDDADEGRQARAGGQQVQVLAGAQVVEHQRAHRLAADHHLVARLQVLQTRCERAVGHLDAEELQVFVMVGAGHAVGAHQRLAVDRQADHHEVAVAKAQGRIARGAEREQGVVPVVDVQDAFGADVCHGRC